jgi:hypothetical protein
LHETRFYDDGNIFYDKTLFDIDKIFDDRTIDNTLFGDRQMFKSSKICIKHVFLMMARFL